MESQVDMAIHHLSGSDDRPAESEENNHDHRKPSGEVRASKVGQQPDHPPTTKAILRVSQLDSAHHVPNPCIRSSGLSKSRADDNDKYCERTFAIFDLFASRLDRSGRTRIFSPSSRAEF